MKISAVIAALALLLLTLLAGCPKSSNLQDRASKPGNVLPDNAGANAPSDTTQGTPPAGGGGAATPPPAGNTSGGGSDSGSSGGGDTGGDDDGGE